MCPPALLQLHRLKIPTDAHDSLHAIYNTIHSFLLLSLPLNYMLLFSYAFIISHTYIPLFSSPLLSSSFRFSPPISSPPSPFSFLSSHPYLSLYSLPLRSISLPCYLMVAMRRRYPVPPCLKRRKPMNMHE